MATHRKTRNTFNVTKPKYGIKRFGDSYLRVLRGNFVVTSW
jgi:hypothetical protein